MKIILINPPLHQNTIRKLGPIVESLFYNSAPLGIAYLASVLEEDAHKVKIIDAALEVLSINKVIERITKFAPDVVGITTFTVSVYSAYELAKKIKIKLPGLKIIIGGPHITSNIDDLLKYPEVDIAVIGEGEVTFKELVEVMAKGGNIEKVKGLAYKLNGRIFATPPREFIPDLDILPFPARHLLPLKLYKPQPSDQKRLPKLSMVSSRGCPYSCIFCDKSVFKNIYRSFSAKYIVNEMSYLVKEFQARDIAFVDSTFTFSKKRVYEIVEKIKNSNLDVTWTCSVRVDIMDRQLLKAMKEAGCWRVRLGIESGNEEVLKFIKKGITKHQVRKVANWTYELDLEPKGFFMLGHLIDTKKTIEETINFACSLPLKDITVQMNTPLKNTAQYRLVEKHGRKITKNLFDYSFWQPVFLPKSLTYAELNSYYKKFYLKFYLRPKVWYRHFIKIRSFSEVVKYLRGIRVLFFFLKSWIKGKL